MEEIRHLQGSVVTQLCLDYGMIDDAVYFTSGEVLGGMQLKEGDQVNCIAVRDGAQGGWKAVRVRLLFFIPGWIHKQQFTLCQLSCVFWGVWWNRTYYFDDFDLILSFR